MPPDKCVAGQVARKVGFDDISQSSGDGHRLAEMSQTRKRAYEDSTGRKEKAVFMCAKGR